MTQKTVRLLSNKDGADKEYRVQLDPKDEGFVVTGFNGRRGGPLKAQPKTPAPVGLEQAQKVFDDLVRSKLKSGYVVDGQAGAQTVPTDVGTPTGIRLHHLTQVPESEIERFLRNDAFLAQEKFDGERRPVARRATVIGSNKNGFQTTLPARVAAALEILPADTELDAEQVGETLYVFDLMRVGGQCLRSTACDERKARLDELLAPLARTAGIVSVETAIGETSKRALYEQLRKTGKEGIVFKRRTGEYGEGKNEDMVKVKFIESATLQVASHHPTKRSVSVQAFDESGNPVALGNVTIPANHAIPALGALVEVSYLYVVRQLVQPVYLGERSDQTLGACTTAQLKYRAEASEEDNAAEEALA